MRVVLTIVKPEHADEVITFEKTVEVTIGRSPSCSICLDFDAMVSRMHAVLLVDPPLVRVKDLNSTNGIIVNGDSFGGPSGNVLQQPRDLRNGDEIMIGTTVIRVGVFDGETAPAPETEPSYPGADSTVLSVDKLKLAERLKGEGEGIGETVSSLSPLLPEVPGYKIRRFLGAGRTGTVYQAVSTATGDKVAIKIFLPEVAFTEKMIELFNRSIMEARRFYHPHIVKILDSGVIGESNMCLIMEFVNGEDLSRYLLRCVDRRIPLRAAYQLMLQICSGLGYAHSQGYIHRDIKPKSILLYDDSGKIMSKVNDLGLVKFLEDAGVSTPGSGIASLESLPYVAPEAVTQFREPKPTLDVFGVGAVFYEMVTGCVPYNFSSEGGGSRIDVVGRGDIVSVEERFPGLPEPLVVIIDRCLSVDPDARYRNCADLLEALENVRM